MNSFDLLYDAALRAGNMERAAVLVEKAAKLQRLDEWGRKSLSFPVIEMPFEEGAPTKQKASEMAAWVRQHSGLYDNKYTLFYHGTDANLDIEKTGLLPTSATRRRSFQSQSGYVYLANTPERAKTFGDLGNQSDSVVYEVAVLVRKLSADTDQLRNQRAVGAECGDSIGESIVFGGGVRHRGKIEPYAVQKLVPLLVVLTDEKGKVIPLSERFPALWQQPTFRIDPEEYAASNLRDIPKGEPGLSFEKLFGQKSYIFRDERGKAVGLLKYAGDQITDVAVAKKFRKRGIAEMLVDAAIADGVTSAKAPFTPGSLALFEKKVSLIHPCWRGGGAISGLSQSGGGVPNSRFCCILA